MDLNPDKPNTRANKKKRMLGQADDSTSAPTIPSLERNIISLKRGKIDNDSLGKTPDRRRVFKLATRERLQTKWFGDLKSFAEARKKPRSDASEQLRSWTTPMETEKRHELHKAIQRVIKDTSSQYFSEYIIQYLLALLDVSKELLLRNLDGAEYVSNFISNCHNMRIYPEYYKNHYDYMPPTALPFLEAVFGHKDYQNGTNILEILDRSVCKNVPFLTFSVKVNGMVLNVGPLEIPQVLEDPETDIDAMIKLIIRNDILEKTDLTELHRTKLNQIEENFDKMLDHFVEYGENNKIIRLPENVRLLFTRLWDVAYEACNARTTPEDRKKYIISAAVKLDFEMLFYHTEDPSIIIPVKLTPSALLFHRFLTTFERLADYKESIKRTRPVVPTKDSSREIPKEVDENESSFTASTPIFSISDSSSGEFDDVHKPLNKMILEPLDVHTTLYEIFRDPANVDEIIMVDSADDEIVVKPADVDEIIRDPIIRDPANVDEIIMVDSADDEIVVKPANVHTTLEEIFRYPAEIIRDQIIRDPANVDEIIMVDPADVDTTLDEMVVADVHTTLNEIFVRICEDPKAFTSASYNLQCMHDSFENDSLVEMVPIAKMPKNIIKIMEIMYHLATKSARLNGDLDNILQKINEIHDTVHRK
jgi:hypothetical protein